MFDDTASKPDTDAASDTVARVRQARKDADRTQAKWRDDAREWYGFVAGDQWTDADKAALEVQLRAPVCFNRIGPMVDSVGGSEVNNRQQVQYIPRNFGDKGLNEVLTGAADYIRDQCDAEDEESDAFLDAVICGIGWTETRLSYDDNPDGDVLVERRDPVHMRWDPDAKKRNLSDRCWQQYEVWLPKAAILERWPKAELAPAGDAVDADEGQPHDQTLAWLYERNATGFDKTTGRLRVIYHQWHETEDFYRVLVDGQTHDLSIADRDKLHKRTKEWNDTAAERQVPPLPVAQELKKTRKKFRQAFVCGSTLLEEGDAPCNRFTFNAVTGKRDRNNGTWYGIVKPMIDPQRWANKFFSQILHIVNTNAKGGLLMEDDAVDNIAKFKKDWSKADSVSVVSPGAISGGKIQPKTPPMIPPQIEAMMQFSISSLRDVTGINLELLGMADRQQAGVLEAQRKQAAMTVLAGLFDGLRRYRKEQGRTLAKFIVDYMSDGRLVRIVQGDGTEKYVPLVKDPQAMEYDVVVDEAPSSVNQREKTFGLLMQLLPNLERAGIPFYAELLEYSPLPAGMVEKWTQLLEQRKGQQDPKQVQQQMQGMQQQIQRMGQQLQQANQQLANRQPELNAEVEKARIDAEAQYRADVEKAQIEAEGKFRAAVETARIQAGVDIQTSEIDAQARAIEAAAQPQPTAEGATQ